MRLFGAAERSGGDSPGCGYRQMFWLVMTVYHYGLILPSPTGWRGVELRGRVQGGVFRDSLGMHPRWSQAPRLLVVESVCVFGVALSSLFVPFGSDVDRLSSVVLCSLLEQSTALFSVGTQSNTEICPIMLDNESRAAPLFAFGRDLGRGMGVEWGEAWKVIGCKLSQRQITQ